MSTTETLLVVGVNALAGFVGPVAYLLIHHLRQNRGEQ